MNKGVLVERFILQKCGMQSNRDWPRIEPKLPSTDQFITSFIKAGHAQTTSLTSNSKEKRSATMGERPHQEHLKAFE